MRPELMPKRTVYTCLVLSILVTATSWAQQPSQDENDLGIPLGYKVIAMDLDRSDAIGHMVRKGDRVDVISIDRDSTIARHVLVFSPPAERKNDARRMYVGLLVRDRVASRIFAAREQGGVILALSPGIAPGTENTDKSRTLEQRLQPSNSSSPRKIEKVRALASDIEKIAAELESLELYDRADELRDQAQKLRVGVRGEK